jgi:hypothetical protein
MKIARLLVVAFVFTGLLFTMSTAKTAAVKKEVSLKVSGTVVSVDSTEPETKIKSGTNALTLGEIKADTKVSISYKKVDGKKIAIQIEEKIAIAPIKTSKKAKGKKAEPAPEAPAAEPTPDAPATEPAPAQ